MLAPEYRSDPDALKRCLFLSLSYLSRHTEAHDLYATCSHVLSRLYRRFGFTAFAKDVVLAGTEKSYTLIQGYAAQVLDSLAGVKPDNARIVPGRGIALNFVQQLFAHYKLYHQHGPQMLRYAGLVGAFGFPIFYVLRFTKSSPPYDDSWIRLAATLVCVLLVLKDRWPQRLKPYYIAFSYPALIFSLPVFLVFTSLKNGGGAAAVGNTLMVAFFVILDDGLAQHHRDAGRQVGRQSCCMWPWFPTRAPRGLCSAPAHARAGRGRRKPFQVCGEQAEAEASAATPRWPDPSPTRCATRSVRSSTTWKKCSGRCRRPPQRNQARTLTVPEVDALYRHLAESELAVKRGLQVIAMTLDEVSEKPMDTAAFSYVSAAEATYKAVQEYGYETDAERARVSVRVVEDFSFRGEETSYLFVLFNLMKNALYYMALCPRAEVTITIERQQVKVRDTGPGIPRACCHGCSNRSGRRASPMEPDWAWLTASGSCAASAARSAASPWRANTRSSRCASRRSASRRGKRTERRYSTARARLSPASAC